MIINVKMTMTNFSHFASVILLAVQPISLTDIHNDANGRKYDTLPINNIYKILIYCKPPYN